MANSGRHRNARGASGNVRRKSGDAPRLTHLLRRARKQFESDAAGWIAELAAAHASMLGTQSDRRFAGAIERLDRLEEALRHAPDRFEKQLRELMGAEQRKFEQGLHELAPPFQDGLFDHAPIGMALVDMDDCHLHVNDAFCRLTGYPRHQLRATSVRNITHPDDVDLDAQNQQRLLAGEIASYQVEKRYAHARGHYVWTLRTVSLVRDDEGKPLYFLSQVQDISERKTREQRLEELVDHDFLTGLFNRRRFEQQLATEVRRAARYGVGGAAGLIDLDNFKDINDRFGHKAGDDLLKRVAVALKRRVRGTDVLARIGGDEFAVILPQADAGQAQLVADGIVKEVRRQAAVLGDQVIHTTASVGVALFDSLTGAQILACADLAMYEAKEAGRDRFVIYVPGTDAPNLVSRRFSELDRVRQALDENRLILYCQPIVDFASNVVSQFELLVRLEGRPGIPPLLPSAFLNVAERFGLIQAIDRWVIHEAVALLAENARAGRPLVLHVNVSGKSIGDPGFASTTEDELCVAGMDPSHLIFELTETEAIANIEGAKSFISRMRKHGCQFALDDFGAGFGSFYYLKYLPFDFLKIDGDFIREFAKNPIDRLVVKAMVDIAQGMGKKTIAEFVENANVGKLLRESGVNYGQGYHLGPPKPVRDVLLAN